MPDPVINPLQPPAAPYGSQSPADLARLAAALGAMQHRPTMSMGPAQAGPLSSPTPPEMQAPDINFGTNETQQQPQQQAPQPTRPPTQSNVPALYGLVNQMFGSGLQGINVPGGTGSVPTNAQGQVAMGQQPQQPMRPASRLDAFENFLGNFLNSFSVGMSNAGAGPAANARGFGAAVQAPYQRELQQYQLGQQNQLQQAQVGQIGAETGEAQARTGLYGAQTQEAQLNTQLTQRRLQMMSQMGESLAKGEDPFSSLGVLNDEEKAIRQGAMFDYQSTGDPRMLFNGIEKIASNRAISGRMSGASSIVGDPQSKTGLAKIYYDRTGKEVKREQGVIVPGLVGKFNSTWKLTTDKDGNTVAVPVTSQSGPMIPGVGGGGGGAAPQAPAPGQGVPVAGPGGSPLHKPLSQAGGTTRGQIYSAMSMADRIAPDLQAIAADIGRGGNLMDAAKVRSAWKQYQDLGIDPAGVDSNSLVSMMPNVDPRLARIMPTIALLQIVGGLPYLRNIRNFNYVAQVQQHLPDPTKDTPQLMVSKLQQLNRNLPGILASVYKGEGITPTLDADIAAHYKQLAGGDSNKARVMARQDGWKF